MYLQWNKKVSNKKDKDWVMSLKQKQKSNIKLRKRSDLWLLEAEGTEEGELEEGGPKAQTSSYADNRRKVNPGGGITGFL